MANSSIVAAFERMWHHVTSALSNKSDISHSHDDMYYTEAEINVKISDINTSIGNVDTSVTNIINGTTVVPNANNAENSNIANSANKATSDGDGNIISSTYETKDNANSKLEEAKDYADTIIINKSDINHNHDSNYDPIGSASEALASAKEYTNNKTSDLASATMIDNKISAHNIETNAHDDIRILINDLTTRLNALADSDDITLDQLSEIVAYIKSNKELIDNVTTSKINISDIINNLTTNVDNKPLSAAQGVAIKSLIDALETKVNNKANSSHTHEVSEISDLTVTSTELNYLDGVTSSVQNQLDSKADIINAISYKKIITSSDDLNDIKENGVYLYTTSSLPVNAPFENASVVEVIGYPTGTTTQKIQRVTRYGNSGSAYRGLSSSGWSTWEYHISSSDKIVPITKGGTGATTADAVLTNLGITATASELNKLDGVTATTTELNYVDGVTSNIQTQINSLSSDIDDCYVLSDNGTAISSNGNLDDYTTAGIYYATATVAASLSNCPTTIGFKLVVEQGYNASRYVQTIYTGNKNSPIYFRKYTSGWGIWMSPLTNILDSSNYGDSLPSAGTAGRIFFKKVSS